MGIPKKAEEKRHGGMLSFSKSKEKRHPGRYFATIESNKASPWPGKADLAESLLRVRVWFFAGQEVHLAMRKGTKRRKISRPDPARAETRKQDQREEVDRVAIGIDCSKCGIPLQVTTADEMKVLASLDATGLVGLRCICGHWQFASSISIKRND